MKLTVEQALDIRRRYENFGRGGSGMASLAMQFGVSRETVHRILNGRHPLVKGAPNISGTRDRGMTWGAVAPTQAGLTPTQRKTATGGQGTPLTQREYRQRPCPKCKARPGEHCTKLRSSAAYDIDLKNVHDERKG